MRPLHQLLLLLQLGNMWTQTVSFFCNLMQFGVPNLKFHDVTTICIMISNTTNSVTSPGQYSVFPSEVDDFALLQISNSSDQTWAQVGSSYHIEFANIRTSEIRQRAAEVPGYVVPFFTVLITLDQGAPQSMDWDTGCFGCDSSTCIDGNCGVSQSDCDSGNVDCDFKVYVGWEGTDRRGVYLTSAGRRYSAFRDYSLGDAYSQASKTLSGQPCSFANRLGNDCEQGDQ